MNTVKINSNGVKMVAHRGLSGIERENTNAAFLAAGNRSYFGIETDVHVTKDKKFVIIHDETTERVTLGEHNYNVEKTNYKEFSNIILPDIDGTTERKDIRIPLLDEYIKICKKYNKVCVLELKNHFEESDLIRLVDEIKEIDYIENVIFISFDLKNCLNARKLLPKSRIQWLIGDSEVTEEMVQILCENHLDIDIYYKKLTKGMIDKFHFYGILVNCWTCDIKEDGEKLVDMGVDFITTNILE